MSQNYFFTSKANKCHSKKIFLGSLQTLPGRDSYIYAKFRIWESLLISVQETMEDKWWRTKLNAQGKNLHFKIWIYFYSKWMCCQQPLRIIHISCKGNVITACIMVALITYPLVWKKVHFSKVGAIFRHFIWILENYMHMSNFPVMPSKRRKNGTLPRNLNTMATLAVFSICPFLK